MRIGRFLGVLMCAGGTALAVGCGTQHAPAGASQPPDLTAAVSHTRGQTARIAATVSTQSPGTTTSITETGLFDFARSRGTITVQRPVGMTLLFVPPTTYIKDPNGKSWFALPDGTSTASGLLSMAGGGGDPADLLASLSAMSSGVTKIGTATIRGVAVTGFAVKVDPAKAAPRIPRADRAGLEALAKNFGAADIPVDVWVDGRNLVRREKLTLPMPSWTGTPAGTHLILTTDFYDFGVPVQVSAPPPSQIDKEGSQFVIGVGAGAAAPTPEAIPLHRRSTIAIQPGV